MPAVRKATAKSKAAGGDASATFGVKGEIYDIHRPDRLRSLPRAVMLNPEDCRITGETKYGVRELALAFIGRGSPRPVLRARAARPGQPGRNKAAASLRTPHEGSKKLIYGTGIRNHAKSLKT
jgi:hypothetical protein